MAFTGVVAQSVLGLVNRNETALAVGLPDLVVPYGSIAAISAILTAAALFIDRRWPHIAATVISGGFLVWWFTWVL
ncbi:hypothetical protein ACFQ0B_30040 [Nonomuraea thailandensis]